MTLERDLQRLARGFPDAPDLAPGVGPAVRRAATRRRRRIVVLALALLLAVPAAALAVSPALRQRVLETFGLRGVTIVRITHLPPTRATARRLQIGPAVTLAAARAAIGARVDPPAALGTPDGIYAEHRATGAVITLLYEPRTVARRLGSRRRVLVSVLRATIDSNLLRKTISQATRVDHLKIQGGTALIVSGVPHLVVFFPSGNGLIQLQSRLAGPTLVWQRQDLIVRVEGDLPNALLVRIARSISTN
jgi:hypothetical protein